MDLATAVFKVRPAFALGGRANLLVLPYFLPPHPYHRHPLHPTLIPKSTYLTQTLTLPAFVVTITMTPVTTVTQTKLAPWPGMNVPMVKRVSRGL